MLLPQHFLLSALVCFDQIQLCGHPVTVFHPLLHYAFDFAAYGASALLFRAQLRASPALHPALGQRGYWACVCAGALGGAWLFGSWNLSLATGLQLGHSVAGGIAGGVAGAELFKRARGLRGSTGAVFVPSLCAGIAVGRLGCFFSGLPDRTFGVPTALPWAVNFGDGTLRHPVQLYEALCAAALLAMALGWKRRFPEAFRRKAFYAFVLAYSSQRFLWEFLKPYDTVLGNFNLFHLLCLAMAAWAGWMLVLNAPDATNGEIRRP